MEEFKTCDLIKELEKREAVQIISVKPYEQIKIITESKEQVLEIKQGPAQVLIVWD